MLTMLRSNGTFLPPLHSERARRTAINDCVEIVLLLSSAFNISVVVAKQFPPPKYRLYLRPVREESVWKRVSRMLLPTWPRKPVPLHFRLLVFVTGITFHPAQAEEHPGPGGTDTAAGSG